MVKLSVLDPSPVRQNGTASEALRETLQLAVVADDLGYYRFWHTEHHCSPLFACVAPELLVGLVAARTTRIRVGTGGVLLSHYGPLKIAEIFRTLESLFPGRIDLGIGRSGGTGDDRVVNALRTDPGQAETEFERKLLCLLSFLSDSQDEREGLVGVRITPTASTSPEVWLLGTGTNSAAYAAVAGCGFCFGLHASPTGGEPILEAYKKSFQPSKFMRAPATSISVSVICADTEAEARVLARSYEHLLMKGGGHQNRSFPELVEVLPSPEELTEYRYDEVEVQLLERVRQSMVVGDPAQVKAKLLAVAERFAVNELIVMTLCYDARARIRSYELLSREFGAELEAGWSSAMETGGDSLARS